MKPSKYNYIIENEDRTIFFNGLTEQLFDVPVDRREIYEAILSSPDAYFETFRQFITRMQQSGFIIENEADEMILLEQKYATLRKDSSYHLMALPTYQCNLRCWYCVQDHQDMVMSDETATKVKEHIENVMLNPLIDKFRLSWFGGEPLMEYDRILSLTTYCRDLSKKHNTIRISFVT